MGHNRKLLMVPTSDVGNAMAAPRSTFCGQTMFPPGFFQRETAKQKKRRCAVAGALAHGMKLRCGFEDRLFLTSLTRTRLSLTQTNDVLAQAVKIALPAVQLDPFDRAGRERRILQKRQSWRVNYAESALEVPSQTM